MPDVNPPLPVQVIAALQQGNKLEAIKLLRKAQGIGLKDAKDSVESYIAHHPQLQQKFAATTNVTMRGCLLGLLCVAALVAAIVFAANAAESKWRPINESDFVATSVPLVGELADEIQNLEYPANEAVRAYQQDVNGDGVNDYFLRSADILCGNGGCQVSVVDGRTQRVIARLTGYPVIIGDESLNGYRVLYTYGHGGRGIGWFTVWVYGGKTYQKVAALALGEDSIENLFKRLDGFEEW